MLGLACGRGGRPCYTIQHRLVEYRGLKSPSIMAKPQSEDFPIAICPRPPQGKGVILHTTQIATAIMELRSRHQVKYFAPVAET